MQQIQETAILVQSNLCLSEHVRRLEIESAERAIAAVAKVILDRFSKGNVSDATDILRGYLRTSAISIIGEVPLRGKACVPIGGAPFLCKAIVTDAGISISTEKVAGAGRSKRVRLAAVIRESILDTQSWAWLGLSKTEPTTLVLDIPSGIAPSAYTTPGSLLLVSFSYD